GAAGDEQAIAELGADLRNAKAGVHDGRLLRGNGPQPDGKGRRLDPRTAGEHDVCDLDARRVDLALVLERNGQRDRPVFPYRDLETFAGHREAQRARAHRTAARDAPPQRGNDRRLPPDLRDVRLTAFILGTVEHDEL